jgi:hypothetical protein
MLLIFGARLYTFTHRRGMFMCPHCHDVTSFRERTARRFGHLFFIPLIPLGSGIRFAECERCASRFRAEVLQSLEQFASQMSALVGGDARGTP